MQTKLWQTSSVANKQLAPTPSDLEASSMAVSGAAAAAAAAEVAPAGYAMPCQSAISQDAHGSLGVWDPCAEQENSKGFR